MQFIPVPENFDEHLPAMKKILSLDFSGVPKENIDKIKEVVHTISTAKNESNFKEVVELNFPLIVNDSTFSPPERVLFIRLLTDKNVNLKFTVFPWFRDFVNSYGPIMRAARSYKEV